MAWLSRLVSMLKSKFAHSERRELQRYQNIARIFLKIIFADKIKIDGAARPIKQPYQ